MLQSHQIRNDDGNIVPAEEVVDRMVNSSFITGKCCPKITTPPLVVSSPHNSSEDIDILLVR